MTGSSKKLNYPEFAGIRLTEDQKRNWNPDKVRGFLDSLSKESDGPVWKSTVEK